MLDVVLFQPEIPGNTGNIIRLCANAGMALHLIHPLGFQLDDARLRRAGLDYAEYARLREHPSLDAYLENGGARRLYACSTRGHTAPSAVRFEPGDGLLFGPETRGLPEELLTHPAVARVLRLPMRPGSRSLNLSNAVAVVAYEAWRQLGYAGAADPPPA